MKIYKRQISPLIVPTDGSVKDESPKWYDEDEREALKKLYEREIVSRNQTLIFVERYVEIGSTELVYYTNEGGEDNGSKEADV